MIIKKEYHNNFDFLRFLFALFVVIAHSYALSGTDISTTWYYQVTNQQVGISSIGLNGFFIISGYLIFMSLERSKTLFEYLKKRFLRLYPGLLVVLFITVLLGPFVYDSNIPYYSNTDVYTYIPNNLSFYNFQSSIKGIFDSHPYHSINGSLWTIRYEVSCYIALCLIFFIKRKTLVKSLLFVAFIILYLGNLFLLKKFAESLVFGMQGLDILNFGAFFVCGSLLASLKIEKLKNKQYILLIAILILAFSVYFNCYGQIKHIILPIVVLLIGLTPLPFLSNFGKAGDPSYGIYIYSFPIQQALMYFFKLDTYYLLFSSVILSIVFGYLSWHLIEKKAMKYKNKPAN